jgi:hypothetical protein
VPVSGGDRAKAFYTEQLGFNVDHDTNLGEGSGSFSSPLPARAARSWSVGDRSGHAAWSLKGFASVSRPTSAWHTLSSDSEAWDVSEIEVMGEGPSPQADPLDDVGFAYFNDPEGNGWAVQQISARGWRSRGQASVAGPRA